MSFTHLGQPIKLFVDVPIKLAQAISLSECCTLIHSRPCSTSPVYLTKPNLPLLPQPFLTSLPLFPLPFLVPCARRVTHSTTLAVGARLCRQRAGKLRRCTWEHLVEILNFKDVVLKPPSLTLRYIMFFALIHEHSRSSSRFPVSLKFWSTVTSPWPLPFACISVAPPWPRSKGVVHCRASDISSCGTTAQASEFPFSELSCPTTCLQGKLVDVWNFLFGVEEVIINGLVNLECCCN